MSAEKPSREERTWAGKEAMALASTAVSCPPRRRCRHCPFSLRGTCQRTAVGPWRSTHGVLAHPHGLAQAATLACALRHNCTCPLLSPVCHQPPQLSERTVSPAHLPAALPLCCTGAPLSVRQRQRHRGTHRAGVGPWHRPWHRAGIAWAALGSRASKLEVSRHSPQTCRQTAGVWVKEVGDDVAPQSPRICHLYPTVGSGAGRQRRLGTGGCGASAPPARARERGGSRAGDRAWSHALPPSHCCGSGNAMSAFGAQQMLWGHRLAQNIPLGDAALCTLKRREDWSSPGAGAGDQWLPCGGSRFGRSAGWAAGQEAGRVHPAVAPVVAVIQVEALQQESLCKDGLNSPALWLVF